MMASSSSVPLISRTEEAFILDGCRDNCRVDGRGRMDVRTYTILTGQQQTNDPPSTASSTASPPPLILSHGSARLLNSTDNNSTHILCSVKAEIVRPASNRPNKGVVELHVDQLLGTRGGRGAGARGEDELQALLQTLLGNHLVDTKALCIVEGLYAWRLSIDVYLLSGSGGGGGSLLDAASQVIRAALCQTLLPSVTVAATATASPRESTTTTTITDSTRKNSAAVVDHASSPSAAVDLLVDGDILAARPPPGIEQAPIVVTVTVMKCSDPTSNSMLPQFVLIVDATEQEEACALAQVYVAVVVGKGDHNSSNNNAAGDTTTTTTTKTNNNNTVCALQTAGRGTVPLSLLPEITATALAAAQHHPCQRFTGQMSLLQEQYAIQ